MEGLQKYCNIFDTLLDSIGPAALANHETRGRVLTTFANILSTLSDAVPFIRSILQIVQGVIGFIRFGQQLYELIMSTLTGSGPNGSRALRY